MPASWATEAFGTHSDVVSVWELEQHFCTKEAFDADINDFSVWEIIGYG